MKRIIIAAMFAAAAVPAFAQPDHGGPDHGRSGHDAPNHGGQRPGFRAHPEWKAGGRINGGDWGRGSAVDWRGHHLRQPPRGYEWREVDGNFVLAAAATGLIASIVAGAN